MHFEHILVRLIGNYLLTRTTDGGATLRKHILLMMMMVFFLFGCATESTQPADTIEENQSEQTEEKSSENKEETRDDEETSEPSKNEDETEEDDAADKKTSDQAPLNELKIHYIDAGQADATLFQYEDEGKTYTILYDAGDWRRNEVVNYLKMHDTSFIDLLIVSHPDADHIGQVAEIMQIFDVGEVWMSGNESTSNTFTSAIEAILASDASYEEPRAGNSAEFGPMTLDVVHPASISGKANEESLSVLFTYGNHKFLFTGDAGKADEREMLARNSQLEADILQLGHHGSNTSSDESFVKAVAPEVAIYSAGENNSYGHPSPEVINLMDKLSITTYGTDVHGTIIVTSDGENYTIETSQDGTISPRSDGQAKSKTTDTSSQSEDKESESNVKEAEINDETTDGCVDINHASEGELQNIIHIGPARAPDVIDNRPYDSVDQLEKVSGIGPARIADIKDEGIACTGG